MSQSKADEEGIRTDLGDLSEQPWSIQVTFLGLWVPYAKGMGYRLTLMCRRCRVRSGFPWILPEEVRMFLKRQEVGGAFCLPSWPIPVTELSWYQCLLV